jgi:hypothetical protein
VTLESGDKSGGAGRKPTEQETPQKTLRGGKRSGAGRPSLGLARTTAPVAEPAAPKGLINQNRVVGGDKRGGKRRGAGRKPAEQGTPRKTLRGGKRPGNGRPSPRLARAIVPVA